MASRTGESKNFLGGVLEFIVMLVVVLVCAFIVRAFVVAPYEIPSGSMEQTIMPGDMVLAEKLSFMVKGDDVQIGDIVTFRDPENPQRTLIKRCIARGGDTIDLQDGKVYLNGIELIEDYVTEPTYPLETAAGEIIEYPYTVPEGYIWVMGDNRTKSSDSRYFGAVPETSVTGRAFAIYWPLGHMGSLV